MAKTKLSIMSLDPHLDVNELMEYAREMEDYLSDLLNSIKNDNAPDISDIRSDVANLIERPHEIPESVRKFKSMVYDTIVPKGYGMSVAPITQTLMEDYRAKCISTINEIRNGNYETDSYKTFVMNRLVPEGRDMIVAIPRITLLEEIVTQVDLVLKDL